jgi:hypothetical protein
VSLLCQGPALVSPLAALLFSTLGAPLIDAFGVRRVVLASLAVSAATHSLFAFGRSRLSVYIFVVVPSEALVGLALYVIALKDLTTRRTRSIAFALSTNLLNGAIVISLNLVEALRHTDITLLGARFSGLRMSVVASTLLIFVEWAMVFWFLHDVRALELPSKPSSAATAEHSAGEGEGGSHNGSAHGNGTVGASDASANGAGTAAIDVLLAPPSPPTPARTDGRRASLFALMPRLRTEESVRTYFGSSPPTRWPFFSSSSNSPPGSAGRRSSGPTTLRASFGAPSAARAAESSTDPSTNDPVDRPTNTDEADGHHVLRRGVDYMIVAKKPPGLSWPPRPVAALSGWASLVRDERFVRLAAYVTPRTPSRQLHTPWDPTPHTPCATPPHT